MLEFTREELCKAHEQTLSQLIKEVGSYTHLAKMLQVPPSTAQGWVSRGRISKDGAKKVEQHPTLGQKFKAKDLRPELT